MDPELGATYCKRVGYIELGHLDVNICVLCGIEEEKERTSFVTAAL